MAILVQLLLLFVMFYWFYEYYNYFYLLSFLVSIITIVYIVNKEGTPEYKIAWIIPIAVFPAAGILLYFLLNIQYKSRSIGKKVNENDDIIKSILKQSNNIEKELEINDKYVNNLVKYMNNCSPYVMYKNTSSIFFKSGEEKFKSLLDDLKDAKKFIFLEYFIIAEGELWESILEILKYKAQCGVEVKIMYDGMCERYALPNNYSLILKSYGIKTIVNNKVIPILSTYQNNRDHRKIAIIDGKIAYTGGANIGDEYVNKIIKYGHWKDTAIRLEGEAVNSFTMIFIGMWNIFANKKLDYKNYLSSYKTSSDGYIMPYADSPLDYNKISKRVYLDMINTATKFVHIETPYLILDNEFSSALKYASKRGIDVKIILPHIPDKKYAFNLARSYYKELLNAGVKIYEYTPGFIHSKIFIVDNIKSVIGTVNLDYRSLYLHFECATYLYKSNTINKMEEDYQEILNKSEEMNLTKYKKISIINRISGRILRLFAPLM